MKRTSATSLITSPGRLDLLSRLANERLFYWGGAFLCCCGLMFLLGIPEELMNDLQAIRLDIQQQQGKVDRLRQDNEQNVNALAARLAELQAASTRLDALGERLAHMGQLTLDEFDFSEPAPIGGPGDIELSQTVSEEELDYAIASLGDKLHRQSSQLDALQFLMVVLISPVHAAQMCLVWPVGWSFGRLPVQGMVKLLRSIMATVIAPVTHTATN